MLSVLVAALCAAFLVLKFVQKGFALDIDTVNLAFLAAGILLHRTPMAYARAVAARRAAHRGS